MALVPHQAADGLGVAVDNLLWNCQDVIHLRSQPTHAAGVDQTRAGRIGMVGPAAVTGPIFTGSNRMS